MRTIITFDPGKGGGVAVHRNGETTSHKMPETEGDLRDFLEEYRQDEVLVVVEKVGGFVGGRGGQPGSAMFGFGRNVGFILGLCAGWKWEVHEVSPQRWMKAYGVSRNGDKDTVWKNRLKALAQQRYPALKVTLATADALLINGYAVEHLARDESARAA